MCRKAQQSHDPAFTFVIGAHHEQHILEGDDNQKGPKNQRKQPQYGSFVSALTGGLETLSQGVNWASTDITVHNAKRSNDECRPPRAVER